MIKDQNKIVALAVPAVACVAYGMLRQDHPVFLTGLALGIVAYLLLRKRLKEHVRDKYGERRKPPEEKEHRTGEDGDPDV